jgi:hypothetical protein
MPMISRCEEADATRKLAAMATQEATFDATVANTNNTNADICRLKTKLDPRCLCKKGGHKASNRKIAPDVGLEPTTLR